MSALAVNQPSDGRQFMIDVICKLRDDPVLLENLRW